MDNINLDRYYHYALLSTSPRGLSPKDLDSLKRTAFEWANEYRNGISLDELCNLIIKQVEHNLIISWYEKSDFDKVAWFTGFFTNAALNAKLATDFEKVFKTAFTKFIDS